MRTEKRIVVITGGSSGLGLGLLKHFEEVGDIVIDISRTGRDYQCDVSDSTKLKKVFEDIGLKYGGIDILITCAGYGITGAVELLKEEDAKKEFDVNFFGTANTCKYAIPKMKKESKIILIASIAGLFPIPFKAYYCSSKAAVDSFAQCLRMELSQTGIQVTSICPGDIKTNFTKNRVKIYDTNERYGQSIRLSTDPTAKSEGRRMNPERALKWLCKICEKKKLKPRYIVGTQQLWFNVARKMLPKSAMIALTTKIFYKKDKNIKK